MFPYAHVQLGQVIASRYRVEEKLGEGGFGSVFRGTRLNDGAAIAMKCLDSELQRNAVASARFDREIEILRELTHPGVPRVLDVVESDAARLLIMEYVNGSSLAGHMARDAPFALHRALHIATQLLDALDAVHLAGVLHRDVKPDNVVVGPNDSVVLVDFGVAAWRDAARNADLTPAHTVMGTPRYAAPEQVGGDAVDARTDLFSVGVLFYEMLTGERPFPAVTAQGTAIADSSMPPTPFAAYRQDLPDALERIVLRALAIKPEERFQNCAAFRNELRGLAVLT